MKQHFSVSVIFLVGYVRESGIPDLASKYLVRFLCICQWNPNNRRFLIMVLLFLSLVLRDMGLMSIEYKCMSSQLLTVRAWNTALLLCSSNIPNFRPKMDLQLLVEVDLWAENYGSRIKSSHETLSKYLVMVVLRIISMVCDLNGLSDSMFVISVRLCWTGVTCCCDSLGSIGLSV